MIDYQTFCQIRQLRDQDKLSVGQIARALSLERATVRKWIGRPRYERLPRHINKLIAQHGYDEVIIDMPLFDMWHTVDISKIAAPHAVVDSALVDDECFKMTAKSRWMTHVKSIDSFKPYAFSKTVTPYNLGKTGRTYPKPTTNPLLDPVKQLRADLFL